MPILHLHSELLRKPLRIVASCVVLGSPIAFAQSGPASAPPPAMASPDSPTPTFEVATIKPQSSTKNDWLGVMDTPDGLNGSGATLYMLMQRAYGLPTSTQVTGGPNWAKTATYDIQAKMSGSDADAMKSLSTAEKKTRRQLMLQALLADRFKLKAHSEMKQVPVFDLVTTKDTSKLKDSATDPNKKINTDGPASMGSIRFNKDSADIKGISMASFAGFLWQQTSEVGRPVLDKTGLTSTYDFTLNWSLMWRMRPGAASTPDPSDAAPSIFTALKEIGLKLQPSTGPIETIIIDHAERPTPD